MRNGMLTKLLQLNALGLKLWVDNGKLKYRQTKKCENKAVQLEWVKENKEELIALLKLNNLTTPDYSTPYIYKTNASVARLSFAQERLWFIEQYEQGTNAYHVPAFFELQENTNKDKLKNAIQKTIQRHEVLRTTFKQEDGEYYQIVHDDKLELEIHDYNNLEVDISKQMEKDINSPFDLQNDFPIRVSFYHKENRTYFLVNIHHIASDGWSIDILLKEINCFYYGESNLSNLVIQYKDFANWQREYLQGEILQNQLSYWKERLQGHEPLALPIDKVRPKQIDYSGDDTAFNINHDLSNKLRNLSKEQGCSMYTTLLCGFYILLSKYTSQDDIVLGTPIANRHYSGIQDLIGFFVNSLALRENINQEYNIVEFISKVQNSVLEAQRYQDLPFEKIVEELAVEQDTSRHPIFQVMFGVQTFGIESENTLFKPAELNSVYSIAKYDLSCFMDDSQNMIQGSFNFATVLFEKSTIERMVNHYLIVLEQMVSDTNKQLKDYSLLTQAEYQQIVIAWNKTDKESPKERTIYQIFEEQVLKTPDNIAIVFEQQHLTYEELNHKSNQLARYLRSQIEINADSLIALCLERCLEMIIGFLGIMKAGGAYVPIDPEYPSERINYILNDTQTEIVLTQSSLVKRLQKIIDVNLIELDSDCYQNQETTNLQIKNKTTDLAYVIYTSGTTGKPKGVMNSHGNIISLVINDFIKVTDKDSFVFLSSPVFDASIFEVWMPLSYGAKLIIPIDTKEIVASSNNFISFLDENSINIIWLTKTLFNTIFINNQSVFKNIKYLLVGGEALNADIINSLIATEDKPQYTINGYGPTESTTFSTTYLIDNIVKNNSVPIGKNLGNRFLYVLDNNICPVPVGVIGELHIGGAGLARGYLNKLELTAEKFIANPFATKEHKVKGYTRLYKTGDLVRWLPDSNLEYMGRNDFQVKVRGYRIELGEIENALTSIEGVKQACVLAKEKDGSKYLIGYFVIENNIEIKEVNILNQLSKQLPNYMVPSALVKMESFPLTINGKLDRKVLPNPEFTSEDSYLAPTTDLEIILCKIWQEVLNLEKVGVIDDFFRIGGDSILSIQLSSRLRKHNLNCSIRDIFDNRTIQKLAKFIEADINKTEILAEQGILEGKFDLLPIQKWFFDKVEDNQFNKFNHWNQSFLVKVPKLEKAKLQNIIQKLTEQHDILRAVYADNQQEYLAKINVPQLKCLNIKHLSELEINNTLTKLQTNFDINNFPLWNITYIEGYQDNSARLFFALHHLIVDTVSWRILIEDFKSLYNNESIENKTSSYRQWGHEVSLYAEKEPQEKDYWDNILKTIPKYDVVKKETAFITIKINKELTSCLLQQTNKAYYTEVNDLLLTALALTLQNWNKKSTQAITLEGHGREQINETIDNSKTVGWFTTMYPVKLELQDSLESNIKTIKESLRNIPNRGVGFGAIYPNKLISLPAISFNYLGQFDTQDEYWQVVSEDSGLAIHTNNIDSNIININGMVVEGELGFSVATKLGNEETVEFANNFQQNLESIILHCKKIIIENESQYTPSDFETVNISQQLLDKIQKENQIEHIYLANSLQQGFIYHALSQTGDDAYRVQILFDYKQELDIGNYIKSWELAIKKYPILRTAFNWEEEIIQIVYSNAKLNYQVLDISDLSETKKEEYIINLQQEDRNIAFDLTKPCILRLYIIKQAENSYTIIKSDHHTITDGWSNPILLNTIHKIYYDLQQNRQVKVEIDNSYLEAQKYFAKQKNNIEKQWQSKISIIEQTNDLNPLLSKKQDLDNIKSLDNSYNTTVKITGNLYLQLKELTKTEGLTLNAIVQFAWHKLIQVYTQDNQTIVGTTVSGRDISVSGIEESVGLYINTLPLIINWDNENTVLQQIQYIHEQITDINTHSFASLASLHQKGKRLFHSLLVFENYPIPITSEIISKDNLTPKFRYAVEKLDYPLGVKAYEQGDKLVISLKSDSEILEEEKANYNLGKIKLLLTELLNNLNNPHNTLSTLTKAEYQQIVVDCNNTYKEFPNDRAVCQLFEEQVLTTPDNIAVVFEEQQLTYTELNAKANQLARYLQSLTTIKPDTLLVLCLDRSLEMIIGILGIMKAGCAYVPIDPEYPEERIIYILDDSQTDLILTQSCLVERLKKITNINLIELDLYYYQNQEKTDLAVHINTSNIAYVIYTSGTTGKPKGVMIEHKSLSNLIFNQISSFYISSEKFVLFASYVFDASIEQIFLSILSGSSLYIPNLNNIKEAYLFEQFLLDNEITHLHSTPSYLNSLEFKHSDIKLKRIVSGGEEFNGNLISKYGGLILNKYGPTETSITSSQLFIQNSDIKISIGTPIANVLYLVLDSKNNPVPQGVIGELHIGGAGLARGYLNNPELTAQKFIQNPFVTKDDIAKGYTRLYKTGDLVKWLPDGNVEYIGRNDFQVKIRGYRIELGEIENALTSIKNIKQACVLAKEKEGNKYLVGYFVSDTEIAEESILNQLVDKLPYYMVPTALVKLDNFPLTINGKLDRKALPDADFKGDEDSYVAPEGELEVKICEIYAQVLVLSVDQISSQQSFFMMGGNSILTIHLKQKLNQIDEFTHITVADLFKYDSIQKLVQSIRADHKIDYKLQNLNKIHNHEVAIIGMSGAFTGVNNTLELWQLIVNQQEGIEFYSEEKCKAVGVDELLLQDRYYIPVACQVKDVDLFDPLFWHMSPNEAKQLDPQIRKFIEHCWIVLESSGYIQNRKLHNIGVFAGSGSSTYFYENILNGEATKNINLWEVSSSNSKAALSTKSAFLLNLTGPANSINTACSTSLVTVVEACKNLQLGTCDMALAGGVFLTMPDQVGYLYQEGMILSKDGHCRTFDKDSTGTIVGAGVGVVLLKRLENAIQDQDNIIAVLKGYATNNDGNRKTGYTAPSVIGQSECVINAQKMAEIQSDDLDYVECHGTATNLGDPIEVQALKEAFVNNSNKDGSSKHKCNLGAIKANIGHTDAAAGVAGLIKVCCMLQSNIIPGQVNFEEVNPELHLEKTNFEITNQNKPWLPKKDKQRLAGVSSFGIGGTNAHVIIGDYIITASEEIRLKKIISVETDKRYVLPISAKNRKSLELYRQSLIEYLSNSEIESKRLADIAYTLQERRELFEYRAAYSAQTVDELISKLKKSSDIIKVELETNNKIIFMFPGQGAQYVEMAKMLYCNDPLFKELLDTCISMANKYLDIDLYLVIYPNLELLKDEQNDKYNINDTQWTQISLFVISYSLTKYLEQLNVKADAYIGHSIGEYVAAALAGVFNLEDAIRVVVARGKLMQSMPPGSMLAIQCDQGIFLKLSKEYHCDIAVINSVEDIVVSGEDQAIDLLKEVLDNRGIPSVKLNTSHAYHSRMMDKAANAFREVFTGIQLNKPGQRQFISNLTGVWADETVTKPEYWCQQLRNRVEFGKGIETICSTHDNQVSFIEVGTGKALCLLVKKYQVNQKAKAIQAIQLLPSLKENKEQNYQAIEYKEDILAQLWMFQITKKPNGPTVFNNNKNLPDLPTYQFDYQKCWLNKSAEQNQSGQGLRLLTNDQWLSSPTWVSVCNLGTSSQGNILFESVLIIITVSQERLYDFSSISYNQHFIILDGNVSDISYGGKNKISINPACESAYKKLLNSLQAYKKFSAIIHLATADRNLKAEDPLDYGFYSLFMIKQHLFPKLKTDHLLILTCGLTQISNENYINPFNGAMVGAIRNINHEYPEINGLVIDIGDELVNDFSFLQLLINNSSFNKSESMLAIKFKKLWRQERQNIENLVCTAPLIKDNDTLLITGGLGGVGLAIAKYISNKHKVNFVLTSRTNIYKNADQSEYVRNKISTINKIMLNGCNVDIRCGDIADADFVKVLIRSVEENYDEINGIIHTAGVVPLLADDYTLENVKNAFKGKVYGINNIIKNIKLKPLKFLANTSSLASIMGDINRIEYCASNSYLDYLCVNKQLLPNTRIVSINWPGWSDVGMVKSHQQNQYIFNSNMSGLDRLLYANTVNGNEGAELFYKLINQDAYEQVFISKLNIELLRKKLFSRESELGHIGKENITILESNYSEIEYKVAQIFCGILGIKEISLEDDFFKIGGNSILAIKLIYMLNKDLSEKNINFNITDLFKHKNIKLLLSDISTENSSDNLFKNLSVIDSNKKQIFFVHPGGGGCEAYADLAKNLKYKYNSFGIDNFNILNEKNINSLNLLAEEYLNVLPNFKQTDEINLCGWSLGGKLALEMGYILEQKGFINIYIYLLDTVLQDEYLISIFNNIDVIEFNQKIEDYMISEGYEENYVNKVLKAVETEKAISKQVVSGRLKSSKVVLFKALQEDKRIDYECRHKVYKYTQSLKGNNVDPFVKNLEVINIECSHGNILDYLVANEKYSNLI